MYSIGLDVSKSTINVYIPKTNLDLVINNDLKSIKSLYSKLKDTVKGPSISNNSINLSFSLSTSDIIYFSFKYHFN